jgi:hypothetical protein
MLALNRLAHLFSTEVPRSHKISQGFPSKLFLNHSGQAKVYEHHFFELRTEHYVCRFDVLMNYVESMHHFKVLIDLIYSKILLVGFLT